ncbi:MAG: hypothetical protein QOJ19_2392, partial [Acidimicrobiia bacterium]|nr:hypothetical protein [Acidimicrobiia bacterium]
MVKRRIVTSIAAALTALTAVSGMAAMAAEPTATGLVAVGPTSPSHGFPVWYRDANGLTLEQCLDGANPLCGFLPGDIPDPNRAISFPANFPEEAFWMLAGATMATRNGGSAGLTLGLEGAFANGAVVPGDQVSFGRVRIRVDNLVEGATYKVTHPYGVDTFTNVSGGVKSINFTDDVGIARNDFTGALNSRVGPFLTWDPISEAPAGFVGDPDVDHRVTGSPYGTNVFRIEGPNVGEAGSPFLCTPSSLDCIQTDLFSLMGKVATASGVTADAAYFTRTADGRSVIDVYAHTDPLDNIRVTGQGFSTTELAADPSGRYYARLDVKGPVPQTITISNLSDQPATVVTTKV